jgi:thiosulfate/3-mercaptopyruvate sulfurtransferase
MKTLFRLRLPDALRRLGAAILFGAALAASVAGAHAEPLVTVEWLNSHRADPDLVVLDIRSIDGGGVQTYAAGHIPGSVHSDYDKAGWRVTRNNVPFMVPTVPELEKLIGDLGIDGATHVVVVPAGVNVLDFGSAARTYWTLKYVGVKNVSILDGGIAAWRQAGLPLESGVKPPSPKIFSATVADSILALANDVETIEGKGGATLVDARPASFFFGKEKAPLPRPTVTSLEL